MWPHFPSHRERPDFFINLPAVILYHRPEILTRDLARLRDQHWEIHEFDGSRWDSFGSFHADLGHTLLPVFYSPNLDSLNDAMRDLEIAPEGSAALVFWRFDRFAKACPREAWHVLNIIQEHARRLLLNRQLLRTLVQCDDPRIHFEPVGASPVEWNYLEFPPEARGISESPGA